MSTEYRNFLALSYEELEELNLAAKADRASRVAADQIREKRLKYLTDEKRIKAVTVLFSDLEGRLHLLDYDKKFLLGSYENLTFDGSSIRGFTAQKESDLRLGIDWSAFYWVPADVFGNGKVPGLRQRHRQGRNPLFRRSARRAQELLRQAVQGKAVHPERRHRNRGLPVRRQGRGTEIPRDRQVRIRQHRRLLPRRCRSIRCASSSTPLPKCSAPWASRTRRITLKSRPASSRSTTATPK